MTAIPKRLFIAWPAILLVSLAILCNPLRLSGAEKTLPYIPDTALASARDSLLAIHGEGMEDLIYRGTGMVASLWHESDGSVADFVEFCTANFMSESEREQNLELVIENLKILQGYSSIIRSRFTEYSSFTDRDEMPPDRFFRDAIPSTDPWKSKLAFFLQLNYPNINPKEVIEQGAMWDRQTWAKARIGDWYAFRRPDDFQVPYREEASRFNRHISAYFLRMGQLISDGKPSPFPVDFLLNCHHGLRDNIKEDYTRENGFERQWLTGQVIERIVKGDIPAEFLADENTWWDPVRQELYRMEQGNLQPVAFTPEGLKRYEGFNWSVRNRQAEDQLYDDGSSALERTFRRSQLSLEQVEDMLRAMLGSPEFKQAGELVSQELGRPLQPFDIWYSGFQAQSRYPANTLDSIVRARYQKPKDLQRDLPTIFRRLGFSENEADWLGNSIEIRPVISGGYSNRPPLPGYPASFTAAFPENGLDYKGFRIAMHELGHVTEMLYSMREADYSILEGVPTGAITEGMAEYLAYRNITALGLDEGSPEEVRHLQALASFWYNVDMGGQALAEIETWKWMTANPDAGPEQVREAMLEISSSVWNEYFAPVFGIRDQHILSIYNHMITGSLYLFNYFVGNVVMFQLYEGFQNEALEIGLARACAEGNTLPDLWMNRAVGENISIQPLLKATGTAVEYFIGQ
jgi:hypothetical protein